MSDAGLRVNSRPKPPAHKATVSPAALRSALAVGRDDDIVVMAHDPHRYDPAVSGHNFVNWSPYAGIALPYRPAATFLRGKMSYDGVNVLAEPGSGAFVRPPYPLAHTQQKAAS